MIGSMLVGLDGSSYADAALQLGMRWGKQSSASLGGMAILDEPTITQGEMVPVGASAFKRHRDQARLQHAQETIDKILSSFKKKCGDASVPCVTRAGCGVPAEELLRALPEYDMLLLGLKTFFRFETHQDPCDTLVQVLKLAPRPVIAVSDPLPEGNGVLIAYDGSIQANRALQLFQAVGLPEVHDVHVLTVDANHETARKKIKAATTFLHHHQIQSHPHAIASSASPADIIMDQADKLKSSLIVMGAYGVSAITEFFFGSTTKTLIQHAKVPLFIYH